MGKEIHYSEIVIAACPMCGADPSSFRFFGHRLGHSSGLRPKLMAGEGKMIIKKCSECDLVFPDPMPIPADLSSHYDVLPEAYWKEPYFQKDPDYFRSELETASKYLFELKGKTALDIGSGLGKGMKVLSDAGFDVYGIEPSPSFFKRSLELFPQWKDRIRCESLERAAFEKEPFDLVNFGAVLEHLQDPGNAILKGMSWLKPGGIMHIEVPYSGWMVSKMVNLQFKLRFTKWVMNLSPKHPPFHLHEFGVRSFLKHAAKNNYKVLSCDHFVGNTYLPAFLNPVLKPIMRLTDTGLGIKVWLQKPVSL